MKKHLPTIIVVVIFICGLSLFLYPTVSNLYNQYLNHKFIGDYVDSFENTSPEQLSEAMAAAVAFNENHGDSEKLKELGLAYEEVLNAAGNGVMGYVEIPKISVSLIIYHTIDEDVLQKGIGHVPETHLPVGGSSTHCVLAGHTGLPSAKLLTNIDHLKIGDRFYIHVLNEVLAGQQAAEILSKLEKEPNNKDNTSIITLDGDAFCGRVVIDKLGIELPIYDEWNYSRLKSSPCRYTGNIATNDIIIAAHNYKSHFGKLKELQIGDEIEFIDANSKSHLYEVCELVNLDGTAVEDMQSGSWDFTLFTCTKSGEQRVTVRCERKK